MRLNHVAAIRLPDAGEGRALGGLVLVTDSGLCGGGVGSWPDVEKAGLLAGEALPGTDPRAAPALYQQLLDGLPDGAGRSATMRAIAIIDQALWDLKAQAGGVPLWRLLGASGEAVRAAMRLGIGESLPGNDGFRAAVLDALPAAVETASAARALLVQLSRNDPIPDLAIALDATGSLDTVAELAQEWLGEMDLARLELAFEGPVPWAALRSLADGLPTAISVRDHLPESGLFPELRAFAVDVVVVDPALRGITGSLQLAEAAYGYELPVVLARSAGRFAAHLAGAMPTLAAVEVDRSGRDLAGLRVGDGAVQLGDKPGIGWAWLDGEGVP